MTVSTIKMTARQFLELGQDPPGVRLELVDGEVAVSPSPNPDHSYTVLTLGAMLRNHIEANDLGQLFTDARRSSRSMRRERSSSTGSWILSSA